MNNTENNQGWIKLHRKLLDNAICDNPKYLSVWICLLLMANHKDQEFIWNNKKIIIKEGQLLTGLKVLSKKTGVAQGTVYRILKYLESEKQIEQQKTTKFTIITIVNWDRYQQSEQQNGKQVENRLKTNGKQIETNKNDKNEKNDKNIYIELDKIRKHYNQVFGRDTKSTEGYRKNYLHWKEIHSTEKIMKAIDAARRDNFWKDKLTLTILFRRKSPQGEDVDYIEDISNRQTQGGGGHLALITD